MAHDKEEKSMLNKEEKSMLNMNEIKGKARQIVGAIKENLGWLTNDQQS
jgi:uncharacterized protein YjbJ (UPF0337 family)